MSKIDQEIAQMLLNPPTSKALHKSRKSKPKSKSSSIRETEQQRLEMKVEDARAHLRSAMKSNATPAMLAELHGSLAGARSELGRCIALDLGHSPAKQGISFECGYCGASGTFDVEPIGNIFTQVCDSPKAAAQIAYRKS